MEVSKETRTRIKENLSKIESAKDIFELFKVLNYPEDIVFDITAKRKKDSFEFRSDDGQKIKEIYSVLSLENKLHIFLLETTSIAPSFIRSVTTTFDRQYLNFLLIMTTDYSEIVFIFPNREKINGDQHKLKLTKLVINRDEIYFTDVQTLSTLIYEEGTKRRQVWRQWRSAFSVERVTKNFFNDYKKAFFLFKKVLSTQGIPKKKSHEFTLQFLNRVMFVYFISKKEGWLNTKRFMKWLWESYKKQGKYGNDEFYEIWLKQVFFKAFNNRANDIKMLPNEVKKEISNFPFLNGGLFTPNDLDGLEIKISDEFYEKIFKFYEKYNFTIKEDMPLEEEVAVDPQMIGYVYESLANVAAEIYDRHDLGIFYTPRVEVDFMARRALIEYLSKNLIDIPKENLYHLVFDPPEEKKKITKDFENKFWHTFEEVLDNLSAIDPACGSGAFLVGLLNVLTEMYRLTYQFLNRKATDFELKKRIIQHSLYGVDIMPWAIHAAELRLWLQLMVETELKKEELRQYPLLPNLDLNLRIGDSLVQEIGGFFFNLRTSDLEPTIKKKLSNLKNEKRNYFDNRPRARFKSLGQVKQEELRLFEEIIESRLSILIDEVKRLQTNIKREKSQKDLFGKPSFDKIKVKALEERITEKKNSLIKLNEIKEIIDIPEKKPFIWDIDFAEIFGEKNGFDIVIGNPPYVRQEDIAPFDKLKSELSETTRKLYKKKLVESVKNQFPVIKKMDGKSDYYIFFYFHGLSLLNANGTFCFITSNSWLDVGYGKDLQEFLLKYTPIKAIFDNPKRAFEHAEINTIIALFGAPTFQAEKLIAGLKIDQGDSWTMLDHIAKFIMFKKPLEEVINSKILIEIENIRADKGSDYMHLIKNLVNTNEYKVFPTSQGDLLNDGWQYPRDYVIGKKEPFKMGKYSVNLWGGKYLNAPSIFFKILERGDKNLCKLEEVVEVRFGNKTGANDFFVLNETKQKLWNIEEEYLKLALRTPKECKSIKIDPDKIKFKVFMCNKPKSELKGTNALKYIISGEKTEIPIKQGKNKGKTIVGYQNVTSIKSRKKWYSLEPNLAPLLWVDIRGDRHLCHLTMDKFFSTHNFHGLTPLKESEIEVVCGLLNSTITWLFIEILGRKGLGGGGIRLLINDLKKNMIIINPKSFNQKEKENIKKKLNILAKREIYSVFKECGLNNTKPILEQDPNPIVDRLDLDNIFFDKIKLNEQERKDIYLFTCKLAKERIDKVKSIKK